MTDIFESKKIWIDPPGGWKYGFPRIYDPKKDNPDVVEWIVDQGYPRKVMESYKKYFNYRCWLAENQE